MEGIDRNQELARRYLLGTLDEERQEEFERRILTDPEFKRMVILTEDELVEEYLESALDADSRAKFDQHFLQTPQQRQRVRIARALKDYAGSGEGREDVPGAERRRAAGLRGRLGGWLAALGRLPKPVLATGLAAVLLTAVLFGLRYAGLWQSRRAAFEAELVRLNTGRGAGRQAPPAVETSLLPLQVLRSGPAESRPGVPTLTLAREAPLVRFRLGLLNGAYDSYRAVFTKMAEGPRAGEVLGAVDLGAGGAGLERTVVIDAPAQTFEGGDYSIQLFGRDAGGRDELIYEYPFRVVRP